MLTRKTLLSPLGLQEQSLFHFLLFSYSFESWPQSPHLFCGPLLLPPCMFPADSMLFS